MFVKRAVNEQKIKLPKVAKIYRYLYGRAAASLCPQTCSNFEELYIGVQQVTFKLTVSCHLF